MSTSKSGPSQRPLVAEAFAASRSGYAGVGVLSLVINLLMLTGPMFMLQIYDRVLASHSVPTLVIIASFAAILYLFFALLEGIRARGLSRISQEIDARLSRTAFLANLRVPLRMGNSGKNVDPIRDLETMRQFWGGQGPAALFDIPWMPIYLGLVFVLHFWLGMLALAGAIIILTLVLANELMSRAPSKELASQNAQRSNTRTGARRNAEVVRALGMSATLTNKWDEANTRFYEAQTKAGDRASLFATGIKAFRFLLGSAVLAVGAWLAIRQEVSPGVMIAASIITSRALSPVEQAVGQWRTFIAARQARARLDKTLDGFDESAPETELPLPSKNLNVQQVATAPPGARAVTLGGINFALNAGDGLGVIGPSGSGKTSLVRALVGVWPILRGSVRLDGAELNQWSEDRLGTAVGYLPQDVELFDGTIAENISRFAPGRDDENVLKAAQLANVHDLVTSLPDGYDTQVGEGGTLLSAGQRQRIGLARALYNTPFLIVLDEPNSNLDSEGEAALTRAIKLMRDAGSIVIVVAHRPSAISAVDLLLVVKDGQQAAFGPKEEVLPKISAPAGAPASAKKPAAAAPAGSLSVVPHA
ncbi:Type I secretion system ATP-binding protein PrsD [Pseudovibrio axinellae]|uniref:Type I secretion system ATP-binding protein PrsD n=1 Tax=Pseudovibrio axinellae TaxID=989403 RepID=A0A165ZFE3_9HYPH|nr:type I secretion system permease/ATPase [Pseudovibrio axinellae]KZL19833.1 Type I secretion system ATP-binding protein PrsD [Pseudovibrio axinellae]SER39722.1 ATP-binding cassette, subfamily C [Pseudovibrio axinellae]